MKQCPRDIPTLRVRPHLPRYAHTHLTPQAAAVVPHIDECNHCSKCIVDSHLDLTAARSLLATPLLTPWHQQPNSQYHSRLPDTIAPIPPANSLSFEQHATLQDGAITGTAAEPSAQRFGRANAQSKYSHARRQHMQAPAAQQSWAHSIFRTGTPLPGSLDDSPGISSGKSLSQQSEDSHSLLSRSTLLNQQALGQQQASQQLQQPELQQQQQQQHRQLQQGQQQQQGHAPPPDLTDAEIMQMFPQAQLKTSLITEAMIRPAGLKSNLLPNCTVCRGCNAEIADIHEQNVQFKDVHFKHGKGATNSWLFFAKPAGETRRFILKVFCMPMSKLHGRPIECNSYVALERIRIMIAAWTLAQECGMAGSTPRMFVAPVNAIVPRNGYHVRWHGLWIEEARGITLHALWMAQYHTNSLMLDLLTNQLNQTQHQRMDLLTAQCDRHAENIFVDQHGGLQFIDNDRALGVVTHCGADSVLLPGGRYHSKVRSEVPKHARTCYVPNGILGTAYPTALTNCMLDISRRSEKEIQEKYALSEIKPAKILKRRAMDLLDKGFEWTLTRGAPISTPKYRLTPQAPCCEASVVSGTVMCKTCWQPLLHNLVTNETIQDDLGIIW
ncbi:MAG: hypothetical protein WDW38_000963 [Sanguina aurantia]